MKRYASHICIPDPPGFRSIRLLVCFAFLVRSFVMLVLVGLLATTARLVEMTSRAGSRFSMVAGAAKVRGVRDYQHRRFRVPLLENVTKAQMSPFVVCL